MRIVIVGNSSHPAPAHFFESARTADLLIAADGGLKFCEEVGLTPHVVIGDLDSVNPASLESIRHKTKVYQYPTEKDFTDIELAFHYAEREGATKLDVFCWSDERIDYAWETLLSFRTTSIPTRLYGVSFLIEILNAKRPKLEIPTSLKTQIKKLSIASLSTKVSLRSVGLKWNLFWDNEFGPKMSLSNQVIDEANIELSQGEAFVLLEVPAEAWISQFDS